MALSQLSPGVVLREIDNSTVTTSSSPAFAAVVGQFARGPINEIRTISTEEQLKSIFGKPNDSNFESWFAVSQYMLYGGTVKVVRSDATALKNAVTNGTATKIQNIDDFEANFETGQDWFFAAKTAGTYGNGVRLFMTDAGPDQILTLDAPLSGDEWKFVEGADISASSGAAAKVYKYSLILKLSNIVGSFAEDDALVGGDNCTVVAYDSTEKIVEITLASDYAGIVSTSDTLNQSSSGASASITSVTRKLLSVTNRGSINFQVGNDITDANSNSVNIGSVAKEYLTREVIKGLRWANIAQRPGTSPFVANKNGFRDEIHVIIVDTEGKVTGTPNTILEKFAGLSKASDARTTNGENNYYATALKNRSNYVYAGSVNTTDIFSVPSGVAIGTAAANSSYNLLQEKSGTTNPIGGDVLVGGQLGATVQYVFNGGVDSYAFNLEAYSTSLALFADSESEQIDFIIPGSMGADDTEALAKAAEILTVVENRADCMAFFSPLRSNVIGITDSEEITRNISTFFSRMPSTSYAAFDSGYKYIYDVYNDTYRYIPCSADIAGLCLATTRNQDPWYSPAGFTRGVLRNAIKLAYSPTKPQRDTLYSERVNPIVSFPGQGIVLFGDKTALGHASAFDRINVRRLFLTIEKVIGSVAKTLLFAQNDETSRSQFRNFAEPYLRGIQGRRGLTDFLVKCDDDNNPPDSVDRGEFYAEIYLKPTRTINYITISFIATRTGVAFEEIAS
jgi:hypothetical protein